MKLVRLLAAAAFTATVLSCTSSPSTSRSADRDEDADANAEWRQWRGPRFTGAATGNPPTRWSEDANVAWKADIPGKGHSSPIVVQGLVIVTTAVPTDKPADPEMLEKIRNATPDFVRRRAHMPDRIMAFTVMAVDRKKGETQWQTVVREQAPIAGTHRDGSWASPSPVSDGERIYAYFGSYGLYCLDLGGHVVWEKDLGDFEMKANFGEGTSPTLCDDLLIVNQDFEGDSFIVALDKQTGDERWRKPRNERTSWSTPLCTKHGGGKQVIVAATDRIRSYDPQTGEVLWECGGMTGNVIPCPVRIDDTVICMSGFRGNQLRAIDLNKARGDVTDSADAIVWSMDDHTPYTPSPVLVGDRLYFLKGNAARLTCIDPRTGKILYASQPIGKDRAKPMGVYSSPVAAADRIYVTGQEGDTVVLRAGDEVDVLAANKLDDRFTASAAIAGDDLYLRGHDYLYCIRRQK